MTTSRLKKFRDLDDMVNMEEALIQGMLQIKDITNSGFSSVSMWSPLVLNISCIKNTICRSYRPLCH